MKKFIAVLTAFVTITAFTSALADPSQGGGLWRPTSNSSTPVSGG